MRIVLVSVLALACAAPADAGPIRNLIGRLRQRVSSPCGGAAQAGPRFAYSESATVFGRTVGYTVQSQRPVLQFRAAPSQACPSCPSGAVAPSQACPSCLNGQCPLK